MLQDHFDLESQNASSKGASNAAQISNSSSPVNAPPNSTMSCGVNAADITSAPIPLNGPTTTNKQPPSRGGQTPFDVTPTQEHSDNVNVLKLEDVSQPFIHLK